MENPNDDGRCVSCGFLAKYPRVGPTRLNTTPKHWEVTETERATGQVFEHTPEPWTGSVATDPVCFRRYEQLSNIIAERVTAGMDRAAAAIEVFTSDRQCSGWFPYQPGLAPLQHWEGLSMIELERRRAEFEERMEERRQAESERRDQERRALDERLHNERQAFDERMNRESRLTQRWGITLALFQVVVGVVAIWASMNCTPAAQLRPALGEPTQVIPASSPVP